MWRLLRTRRTGLASAGAQIGCLRAGAVAEAIMLLAALLLTAFDPLAVRPVEAAQSPTEFQVKAAYLFNFLKFMEWPDDPGADPRAKWIIGFVGDTPVSDELERLVEGKSVLGRDLQVRKFQPADNLSACNILFISESQKKTATRDSGGPARLQRADGCGHGKFYQRGRNGRIRGGRLARESGH
jgi:YfiR/HmsC-like